MHSPTDGEVPAITAGLYHWTTGFFDLYEVNPPLPRLWATIPVLCMKAKTDFEPMLVTLEQRPEFDIGKSFLELNGTNAARMTMFARWFSIPIALLGNWYCFKWARELYGTAAGLGTLFLESFHPLMLGYQELALSDSFAASWGTVACYMFWHWLKRPSIGRAMSTGITLGLAISSKLTWVAGAGAWLIVFFATWLVSRRIAKRSSSPSFFGMALILLIALYIVNTFYLFSGSFLPLRAYAFRSAALRRVWDSTEDRSESSMRRVLEDIPVPVPVNFLRGIDLQKRDFEISHHCFINGRWGDRGPWYFYLFALALKTPIGFLILFVVAVLDRIVAAVAFRQFTMDALGELAAFCPAVVIFGLVSSQTRLTEHLRYILPVIPLVAVLLGSVLRSDTCKNPIRMVKIVGALAIGIGVLESTIAYPHGLTYFNSLGGGSCCGYQRLTGSNVNWGQDMFFVSRWYRAHSDLEIPPAIADSSYFTAKHAGIIFREVPLSSETTLVHPRCRDRDYGPHPGCFIVSKSLLNDVYRRYSYFRHFAPDETIGNSFAVYHISEADAERVRALLGLESLSSYH